MIGGTMFARTSLVILFVSVNVFNPLMVNGFHKNCRMDL